MITIKKKVQRRLGEQPNKRRVYVQATADQKKKKNVE